MLSIYSVTRLTWDTSRDILKAVDPSPAVPVDVGLIVPLPYTESESGLVHNSQWIYYTLIPVDFYLQIGLVY